MTKAIEALSGPDIAAFRAAIEPHLLAILTAQGFTLEALGEALDAVEAALSAGLTDVDAALTAGLTNLATARGTALTDVEAARVAALAQLAVQLATVGLSTQTTHDVVEEVQDGTGKWWSQRRSDGSTRIQKLCDANGNRIDTMAADAVSRVKALEDIGAGSTPASIQRIRRAYYDAKRRIVIGNTGQFVSYVGNSDGAVDLIAGGITYPKESPFIRRLGGPWVQPGTTYPANSVMLQQNVTYLSANSPRAGNAMIELLIDAGVTQIEWKGTAASYVGLVIDGLTPFAAGVSVTDGNPMPAGGYRSMMITLAPSALPRRVRMSFARDSQIGAIRVNAGGKLLDPILARRCSGYFLGDSITEGSNASPNGFLSWMQLFARKAGIDNYANGGVGGTGWTRSISTGDPAIARLPRILEMVDGGPPDLLFILMGINDVASTQADLDAITAAVNTFMTQLRASAPYTHVICGGPFGSYSGWGTQGPKQTTIFNAISQYPLVDTVDTSVWWNDPAVYQTWYTPENDTTHPNNTGHEAISNLAVRDFLPRMKAA